MAKNEAQFQARWEQDGKVQISIHNTMILARQNAMQMSKKFEWAQAAEIYYDGDKERIGKNFAFENGKATKLEKEPVKPRKKKTATTTKAKKKVAKATPRARTAAKKAKPGTTTPKKARKSTGGGKSPKPDTVPTDPVCAEWGVRKGTLVDTMVRMFLDNLGKPVSLKALSKKLYGNQKVSDHNVKLSMGLKNMVWRLHIKDLPYKLSKAKETYRAETVSYTLAAV